MELRLIELTVILLVVSNVILHRREGKIIDSLLRITQYVCGVKEPIKTPLKPIFKPKKQEETEEERKYNAIIDNIDNYDGTGRNQKEVR